MAADARCVEDLPGDLCCFDHFVERRLFIGVEVDDAPVGAIGFGGAAAPGI